MNQNLSIVSVKNEVISAQLTAPEMQNLTLHINFTYKKWFNNHWNRIQKTNRLVVLTIIIKKRHKVKEMEIKTIRVPASRHGNTHFVNERALFSFVCISCIPLVWTTTNVHYKTFGVRPGGSRRGTVSFKNVHCNAWLACHRNGLVLLYHPQQQ